MASLTTTVPVLSVGGIAKEFLVPGWRVGWVIVYDRHSLFAAVHPSCPQRLQRVFADVGSYMTGPQRPFRVIADYIELLLLDSGK
jgi:aspartate/methionine/tyrosine aminotransferase